MGSADGEETTQGPGGRAEERVLVSVRVRPLNEKETLRNEVVDWECINGTTVIYKNHLSPERSMYPTSYTFDRVFKSDCSTKQVYEEGAKAVVLSAVKGINSSVFAYGQTSSGKTFTMSGITEYTMKDIFDYIQKNNERAFQLKFCAMEIYNESVRDLLTADTSPLRLLDDPERGTVVEKLTEETLRDWDHFQELLAVCEAQRQIGETFLNEASSRSHQILRLTIESSTREYLGKNTSSNLAATLNFVDLAGSERASQALSAGSRLKEGSHINRSLLTLGTVIRKLSKGRTGHIPYRDSKLTRILQSSLGGNARTAVICTMSPARSYVEQSRNTLLFASCAKEVTTNARVNVIMSDKVLVKHLQRELARLEGELRTSSPSLRADASHLLREKDSKIEELESRVKELTQQLDRALSHLQDLQQGVEFRSPTIWEGEDSSYPKLHVRQASESSRSETTTVADHHSFDAGSPAFETPQSPDRHSYDENYSMSDFDENLPPTSPFERMFIETPSDASSPIQCPNLVGHERNRNTEGHGEQATNVRKVDPYIVSGEIGEESSSDEIEQHQVSEETGEQTPDRFEIRLQQVLDGTGAQSPYFVEFDPYQVSDEIEEQTPDSFEIDQYQVSVGVSEKNLKFDNLDLQQTHEAIGKQTDDHLEDYCKEVQCIESGMTDNVQTNSLPLEEEGESASLMDHDNDRHTDDEPKQETELSNALPHPEEPSDRQLDEVPELKYLDCLEDKRNRSNDTSSISSFPDKLNCDMKNECEDRQDDFIVKLEDVQRKLSALRCETENEVSEISTGDIQLEEIPVTEIKVSSHIDNTENITCIAETKEITEHHFMEQLHDSQLVDTLDRANKPVKNVKDVGLNPQDDLDTGSPWLSDFKRLQGEIIDLWDTCNVSLVHRTHFFLLFVKCDSEDTIYMEVERRRLSIIKDAFSWGNSIMLDGRKLTPGSSKKSLHSEREMLGRLMKKRLSTQERNDLFVKWGISLEAKRRSSQLAHRLWTDTMDMDHIVESANIVAKLVRFSEPQMPKEVFGLNLTTNLGRRKSFTSRW